MFSLGGDSSIYPNLASVSCTRKAYLGHIMQNVCQQCKINITKTRP